MKLATYQDGSRDGQLVVVSRDLQWAHYASGIACHMRQLLDDWNFYAPQLQALSDQLNAGRAAHPFAFNAQQCMAVLPRPAQWLHAQCYAWPEFAPQSEPSPKSPNDLSGVSSAATVALRQGNPSAVSGPHCTLHARHWGADVELDVQAMLAVICGDVPQGAQEDETLHAPRLFTLAAQAQLLTVGHEGQQLTNASHVGDVRAWPVVAFAPVAVTVDELSAGMDEQLRLHWPLRFTLNQRKIGLCDMALSLRWTWAQTIAQAARYSAVVAGTIIGSGQPIHAQRQNDGPDDERQLAGTAAAATMGAWSFPQGHASLSARRMAAQGKKAATQHIALMQRGDVVAASVQDRNGHSVFGTVQVRLED